MTTPSGPRKRFGMIAVEKGFVDPIHIASALEEQMKETIDIGIHRKIGAILFDQGLLNAGQIHDVLSSLDSNVQ